MPVFRIGMIILLLAGPFFSFGQSEGFNSFISRISDQYSVDVAIAPELIPVLDSLRNVGTHISSVEELLYRLLNHSGITWQIVDGNKVMLRNEDPALAIHPLAVLRGTIADQQTGLSLPYATVIALPSGVACNADEQGRFILPVSDTSGHLRITYLGYQTQSVPLSDFLSGNPTVYLQVREMPLEEVTIVVPYNLMGHDYTRQSTDLNGYQFISQDQLLSWNAERLITSLTAYTHFSSDQGIRIRSRTAGNSVIIMDDIPVYDPYHFYNIFSPFNGHYFSSVEVYKNNLPIEFGGRIDGMIHVSSDRDQPKSSLILDTDLLLTSLIAEIAISPKVYATAAGRVSHTGIIQKALSDSTVTSFSLPGRFRNENEWTSSQQPASDFYDLNFGLTIQPGKESVIRLRYFESQDKLDNIINTNFETFILTQGVVSIRQKHVSHDEWHNRGVSAAYEAGIGNATSFHMYTFYSAFDKRVRYYSRIEEIRQGMTRMYQGLGLQRNELSSLGAKSFFRHQKGKQPGYVLGLEHQVHHVDLIARENGFPFLAQIQRENETTLFGEYSYGLSKPLEWALGMRLTHLYSTGQVYTLPNLRMQYKVHQDYSLRAAYSKSLQSVHALTVENRFGRELDYFVLSEPEENYPVLTSDKLMIGAGYATPHLTLDVEGYYKKMNGLVRVRPLRPDPSLGVPMLPEDFYRLFAGEGWTSGVDFTALYKKKKIEASLLYTLSKIAERYPMLYNGDYFSPQEDRRHQIKVAGIYSVGKFRISSLINFKSKAPYLSLIRLEGRDDISMVDQQEVQRYLPPYFSLDMGMEYVFHLRKQPAVIGISLINATDHTNVSDLQHLGRVNREGGGSLFVTNQTELLGRTANVHFRFLLN